jgi:hypothetical protein
MSDTVRLTSIHPLQIEAKSHVTAARLTNLFMVALTTEQVSATIKKSWHHWKLAQHLASIRCWVNLEEPVRVASPTRINLEEPIRVASPTRINLEQEPISSGYPAETGLTWRNPFLLVTQPT